MGRPRLRIISAVIGLILCVLALVGWMYWYCPQDGPVEVLFTFPYRIKAGMTHSEVESILGPGTKQIAPPGTVGRKGEPIPLVQGDEFYSWDRTTYTIWVGFKDGRVCDQWLEEFSL
jgi:hypothetical protein